MLLQCDYIDTSVGYLNLMISFCSVVCPQCLLHFFVKKIIIIYNVCVYSTLQILIYVQRKISRRKYFMGKDNMIYFVQFFVIGISFIIILRLVQNKSNILILECERKYFRFHFHNYSTIVKSYCSVFIRKISFIWFSSTLT